MKIKAPYNRYLMMVGLALLISVLNSHGPFVWVFPLTLLSTFTYWEGNYRLASYAREKYPKFEDSRKRILFQVVVTLAYTLVVGLALVAIINFVSTTPREDKYFPMVIQVGLAVTVIISIVYETVYYFHLWKESLLESERLKKNQARLQFESLKSQVNPHFLFNSLNTLSSLIPVDPEKAERFVQEFAKTYRYVLETKDQTFVPLTEELAFVQSYLFLQKIRFENQLTVEMRIGDDAEDYFIPPLTLQILVENAVKHNVISDKYPLMIAISLTDGVLRVVNKIHRRMDTPDSTKTGLQNITQRMKLVSDIEPRFFVREGHYVAEIPLIQGN